jgi:hypothetical protein
MTRSKLIPTLILILLLMACGPGNSRRSNGQNLPPDFEELSPTSSRVVYPDGWEEITINANWAKTLVNTTAHFTTSRNACGKDAYGAFDLETWNNLSKDLNAMLKMPRLQEDFCVDPPETPDYKFMDGSVELKPDNSNVKQTVFEYKDGRICSRIKDPKLSNKLLNLIQKVIIMADKEDCTNGWGRD